MQWDLASHREGRYSDESCYSSGTESCPDVLVFGYEFRLPYYWPIVWCVKAYHFCHIQRKCAAIVKISLLKYIHISTGNSLKAVIEGFQEKLDFPQCVGVVDGTHIPIVSSVKCPAHYYNRKGWHFIIMQGTVDHLGHIIDNVGWPGRVYHARVFVNSSLYKKV